VRASSIAAAFFTPALFAAALSLSGGCDRSLLPELVFPPDGGVGGGPSFYDGGSDAGDAGSPTLPDAGDAGPEAVLVGILPTPKTNGDGKPTVGEKLEVFTSRAPGASPVVYEPAGQLASLGSVSGGKALVTLTLTSEKQSQPGVIQTDTLTELVDVP